MLQVDPEKEELIQADDTFRSLYEEHREYKQRLVNIRQRSLPSAQDEIEIKRIKLHNLSLKDRMEAILREHSRTDATA